MKILITGASGSGTTTLAKELACELKCPHFDGDDYFWMPTEPPFQIPRDNELRNKMVLDDFAKNSLFVFSGNVTKWNKLIENSFNLIVYLYLPVNIRLERLKNREKERLGNSANPGGEMHQQFLDFIDWASHYDDGEVSAGRTKEKD